MGTREQAADRSDEEGATVKGSYVDNAIDFVREHHGQEAAAQVLDALQLGGGIRPHREYPVRLMSRVVLLTKERFRPEQSMSEVAEAFGRYAFGTFAQSLVGKVGLNLALVGPPKRVAESVVAMHQATSKGSFCEVKEVGEGSFTLRYWGTISPHWTLGVMGVGFGAAGGKVSLGEIRSIEVDEDWQTDADFDLIVELPKP